MIHPQPKLQPLGDGTKRWVLLESYAYNIMLKGRYYADIAPAGFISDGSSLPLGIMYGRHDPDMAASWIPHDHGFATGKIPQKFLDTLYRDRGIDQGMKNWKMRAAYRALRMFGSRAYKKHERERLNNPKAHAEKYGLPLPAGVKQTR